MQGTWRRQEGREQWIIRRAEKGRPEDATLIELVIGNAGAGRGGKGLRNAESVQLSTQESDPPTPTLFISLEGVASMGLCDLVQR